MIKNNKLLVGMIGFYGLLIAFKADLGLVALKNTSYYLFELVTILPVIFMMTVAIEVLIPKEWIVNQLGDQSGLRGLGLAFALGSLSAGPIYAAFPIGKSLHEKGASLKNIVVILSAWAVIKVPMLANEAKFLGPKFMVSRWLLTLVAILIMGQVMTWLKVPIKGEDDQDSFGVNQSLCLACGVCVRGIPDLFQETREGVCLKTSDLKKLTKEEMACLEKIKDQCPVGAISL